MSSGIEETSGDQRRSPRLRSVLAGKIVYGDGYFTVSCLVKDLSKNGAKVKIPEGQALPATVYFLELRSGGAYEARVVWRRHPEVGLQFIRPCPIDDPHDEVMRVLRRLWVEAQVRTGPM